MARAGRHWNRAKTRATAASNWIEFEHGEKMLIQHSYFIRNKHASVCCSLFCTSYISLFLLLFSRSRSLWKMESRIWFQQAFGSWTGNFVRPSMQTNVCFRADDITEKHLFLLFFTTNWLSSLTPSFIDSVWVTEALHDRTKLINIIIILYSIKN